MSDRDATGYAMVIVAYLLVGLSGTLVALVTAPASLLLVLRFAVAFAVLAAVFLRPWRLTQLRTAGVSRRLLLMGAFDAATLLLFFIAVRETGVAVATFLYFTQPVWIALLAPRFLGSQTDAVVWAALGIALAGLVLILVPAFSGVAGVSWAGLAAGLGCGVLYAGFALLVKDLSAKLDSITLVLSESVLDVTFLLPLALWQTAVTGYALTRDDLIVAVVLGVVCTALAYTLWMEGTRRIRMQHSALFGFLTPVAAPFFAFALAGQRISVWTAIGGGLILVSGLLVALRGRVDVRDEVPQ